MSTRSPRTDYARVEYRAVTANNVMQRFVTQHARRAESASVSRARECVR